MTPKKRASEPPRRGLLPVVLAAGLVAVVIVLALYFRSPTRTDRPTAIGAPEAVPAASPVSTPAEQAPVPAPTAPPPARAEAPSPPSSPARDVSDLPPLPPGTPVRPRDVVAAVYEFAGRRPDVLRYVPCFCGCEQAGHKGNDDCFVKRRDARGRVVEWEPHGMT